MKLQLNTYLTLSGEKNGDEEKAVLKKMIKENKDKIEKEEKKN